MKVLIVSKALVVGEYQKKAQAIAGHEGIEVVAVVPPIWRDAAFDRRLDRAHIEGYTLIESPIWLNGHFHLFFFPWLGKILDEQKPDILHVDEEPYNLATFLAVRAARQRHIPSVFFTWQNLSRRYPWPFFQMERYVYRTAAWALAGTPAAARVLTLKGYQGPLSVVPQFGVDPETFCPGIRTTRALATADDPVRVGFAGRLVPEKGIDVLLDALALLPQRFHLAILGDGPARQPAQARCYALGIASRVTFEDPISSAEMAKWLHTIDVLALPSVSRPNWAEQFGRVLVEAMACGLPVVGSSCGEIPEVVGEAGLIFPEGDARAFARALGQIGDSPELRQTLGFRGRERVIGRFTHDRVAEQTVEAYRGVHARPAP